MKRTLILHELRAHAPFTALGTLVGIALLLGLLWAQVSETASHRLFGVLHPLHVLLSAQATIATFRQPMAKGCGAFSGSAIWDPWASRP